MLTKHSLNWFNSLRPSDAYMRRNLTNIGSDNGLSPGRCQTIIWSRDRSNIVNGTHRNKLQWKIRLTMSSAKYQPFCVSLNVLTNWRRDKMATILQTVLLNTFSWMKTLKFWLKFHWILFQTVQLIIFQHWFRWWLGAILATSHYITLARPRALIQVCSTPLCMVQCTHLITTGGTPHLYNRGSSMLVNSLHSGENDM